MKKIKKMKKKISVFVLSVLLLTMAGFNCYAFDLARSEYSEAFEITDYTQFDKDCMDEYEGVDSGCDRFRQDFVYLTDETAVASGNAAASVAERTQIYNYELDLNRTELVVNIKNQGSDENIILTLIFDGDPEMLDYETPDGDIEPLLTGDPEYTENICDGYHSVILDMDRETLENISCYSSDEGNVNVIRLSSEGETFKIESISIEEVYGSYCDVYVIGEEQTDRWNEYMAKLDYTAGAGEYSVCKYSIEDKNIVISATGSDSVRTEIPEYELDDLTGYSVEIEECTEEDLQQYFAGTEVYEEENEEDLMDVDIEEREYDSLDSGCSAMLYEDSYLFSTYDDKYTVSFNTDSLEKTVQTVLYAPDEDAGIGNSGAGAAADMLGSRYEDLAANGQIMLLKVADLKDSEFAGQLELISGYGEDTGDGSGQSEDTDSENTEVTEISGVSTSGDGAAETEASPEPGTSSEISDNTENAAQADDTGADEETAAEEAGIHEDTVVRVITADIAQISDDTAGAVQEEETKDAAQNDGEAPGSAVPESETAVHEDTEVTIVAVDETAADTAETEAETSGTVSEEILQDDTDPEKVHICSFVKGDGEIYTADEETITLSEAFLKKASYCAADSDGIVCAVYNIHGRLLEICEGYTEEDIAAFILLPDVTPVSEDECCGIKEIRINYNDVMMQDGIYAEIYVNDSEGMYIDEDSSISTILQVDTVTEFTVETDKLNGSFRITGNAERETVTIAEDDNYSVTYIEKYAVSELTLSENMGDNVGEPMPLVIPSAVAAEVDSGEKKKKEEDDEDGGEDEGTEPVNDPEEDTLETEIIAEAAVTESESIYNEEVSD